MIDLHEIRETIETIRSRGTTVKEAEQLALLYIARDYMEREGMDAPSPEAGYARAAAPDPAPAVVRAEPKSDFLAACDGVEVGRLLAVLDEYFEAYGVISPRACEALLARIRAEK